MGPSVACRFSGEKKVCALIKINAQRLRNEIILNALRTIFNDERDGLTISTETNSVTVTNQLYRERRGIISGQPQSFEVKWDASYMLTVTADPFDIPKEFVAPNDWMKGSIGSFPKSISVFQSTKLIQTVADLDHYALYAIEYIAFFVFWDTILGSRLAKNIPLNLIRSSVRDTEGCTISIYSFDENSYLELKVEKMYEHDLPFRTITIRPSNPMKKCVRENFLAMCSLLATNFGTGSLDFDTFYQDKWTWGIRQRLETMSDIDVLMRLLVFAQTIFLA